MPPLRDLARGLPSVPLPLVHHIEKLLPCQIPPHVFVEQTHKSGVRRGGAAGGVGGDEGGGEVPEGAVGGEGFFGEDVEAGDVA
jgi:hypothetical protein